MSSELSGQFRLDGIMNRTGRPDPNTDRQSDRQIIHGRASGRPHTNTHTQMAGVADKRCTFAHIVLGEYAQDGYLISCKCAVSQNIRLWIHCTTTQIL